MLWPQVGAPILDTKSIANIWSDKLKIQHINLLELITTNCSQLTKRFIVEKACNKDRQQGNYRQYCLCEYSGEKFEITLPRNSQNLEELSYQYTLF